MVKIILILIALVATVSYGQESSTNIDKAIVYYQNSKFHESINYLQDKNNKSVDAYLWLGKNYFMLGDFKKACDYLEGAVDNDRDSARLHQWLGRAYGKRAEYSNLFIAPRYAVKARKELEEAVRLCPHCVGMQLDLFEYYLNAPGFIGGGHDKAFNVAKLLDDLDMAVGYQALSELAESKKNYGLAEEHLGWVIRLFPWRAAVYINMATFLARQRRFKESEALFSQAESLDPDNPVLFFERAQMYINSGGDLDLARDLLNKYLKSNPDFDYTLSRFEAVKLLEKIKK